MEQEEIKGKFDDLKDKSAQIIAENQKKAMSLVDRLFGWLQRISCVFAVLLVCLFAVILVYSALFALFHRADSKLAPDYKEYSLKNPVKVEKKVDTSSIEINKNFGDELKQICELAGKEKPEGVVERIVSIEERHRKTFIKGVLGFLKDAKESIGKEYKPEEQGADLYDAYFANFMEGVNDLPNREAKAKLECEAAWMRVLGAMFGILVVMLLITLIKIEKNTRKE